MHSAFCASPLVAWSEMQACLRETSADGNLSEKAIYGPGGKKRCQMAICNPQQMHSAFFYQSIFISAV